MTSSPASETTAVCTDCSERVAVADLRQHMADLHGVMYAPYEKGPARPKISMPTRGAMLATVMTRFVTEANVLAAWMEQTAQRFEESRQRVLDCREHQVCTDCTDTVPCERAAALLSGGGK